MRNNSETTKPVSHESSEGKEHTHSKEAVHSATPENAEGQLNPSSPGNTGTTPSTNSKVG